MSGDGQYVLVPLVRPVEAVRPSPPVPARTPDKKWDPAEGAGRAAHAEGIHRAAAAAEESGPLLSTVMLSCCASRVVPFAAVCRPLRWVGVRTVRTKFDDREIERFVHRNSYT